MVKQRKNNTKKKRNGKGFKANGAKAGKINASTVFETREYLIGKLRKGQTVSGKEAADFIKKIKNHVPGCVQQVLLRADGEFLSWQSVAACIEAGFDFIIANKGCNPPFDPHSWYRPFKRIIIEYNIWRYLKMIAQISISDDQGDQAHGGVMGL